MISIAPRIFFLIYNDKTMLFIPQDFFSCRKIFFPCSMKQYLIVARKKILWKKDVLLPYQEKKNWDQK